MKARRSSLSIQSKFQTHRGCSVKGQKILVSVLALGLLLAVSSSAGAGPSGQGVGNSAVQTVALAAPGLISYQGRLVDAAGNPVADGPYSMTFRLYGVSAGGAALWTESKTVSVTGGLFTTLLGDTVALDPGLFDGRDLWLGVQVGAEAEMTPRQRIASVPYALYSNNADTLDGSHASAFALATHQHDARYVNVDGDVMRANLDGVPALDVTNAGTGFGVSGYGASNVGVYGSSGAGSSMVGISGLIGVYGNGEDTGVSGAGRQIGVRGIGIAGIGVKGSGLTGVLGESIAGSGVRGQGGAYGVYGSSESGMGVFGVATGPASLAPGVYGRHQGAGPGVQGQSVSGEGVRGTSVSGPGGVFTSTNALGAYVASTESYGMKVQSDDDIGVYAHSGRWTHPIFYSGHYAVLGVAEEGTGVWGKGVTGGLFTGYEGVRATGEVTGVTGIGGLFGTGVYGEAPSGAGVRGKGDAGVIGDGQIGVQGTGLIGVDGQGMQKGVQGVATDYNAVGVEGRANFGTGVRGWGETGVYGESSVGPGVVGRGSMGVSGTSTVGYGVSGTTENANAAGVYAEGAGENDADLILGGISSANDNGLLSSAPWLNHSDLVFHSNDEFHIYLDRNGDGAGEFRIYNGTAGPTWNIVFRVDESGNTWASGTKGAIVPTKDQGMRSLYALESTGVWFEDFGLAQLQDGVAVVKIDPLFAETVNLGVGYHVFLTPVDGWAALYVANKTPTSFEVRDANGKSNVAFDYRVVARRLGYENLRMEPVEPAAEEEQP